MLSVTNIDALQYRLPEVLRYTSAEMRALKSLRGSLRRWPNVSKKLVIPLPPARPTASEMAMRAPPRNERMFVDQCPPRHMSGPKEWQDSSAEWLHKSAQAQEPGWLSLCRREGPPIRATTYENWARLENPSGRILDARTVTWVLMLAHMYPLHDTVLTNLTSIGSRTIHNNSLVMLAYDFCGVQWSTLSEWVIFDDSEFPDDKTLCHLKFTRVTSSSSHL